MALLAFVLGVLIHACVALAVLQDDAAGVRATSAPTAVPTQVASPTPTGLVDRTNCAEIRGTAYRSETERVWFQRNCSAVQ